MVYSGRMRIPAFVLAFLLPASVLAQSSGEILTETPTGIPSGTATVTIEQVSIDGHMGSWLLSTPSHEQLSGSAEAQTLAEIPTGNYVVYATLPSGTKSTIRLYRNGTQENFFERQQTPFAVYPGDVVRIVIHYHLDKVGIVSVQSDPDGTAFVLSGPDGASYAGVTPQIYEDLPEGQYKVQYESFAEGCLKPAPKASQLVEDGRISFEITFDCDAANKVRERQGKDTKKYLTIVADGESVQLQDVQQKDWFSTYVFEAAKRDILSGYRDAAGRPTGTFGPGNSVTVAELSKIAHRMAGISEEAFGNVQPKNAAGMGHWFSAFLASSENRGWIIYADGTVDPGRPATRGEVLVTLMQAFDVALRWQKGNVFVDVPVTHPYAAAIETAAGDGVIAGRTDEKGTATGRFDPEAPITRAEIAKVITTILDTYESPATLRNAAGRRGE